MAHLLLKGLSKTYAGGVQALHPVDLEVGDGQLTVLVGPSGCGKSTLLRMIAGLESPTSGEILLDGEPITSRAPKDRDMAMVFQNYALYPHMTVAENIGFGLKMRGISAEVRKREVERVAEMLALQPLLGRRPKQLSGGQQQRVALGRAIARQPKLFLFDEPFSNLDATLRSSTRTELLRLHRRLRATSVFVTHDQVEAMTMADVLVVMRDGRVLQSGPPLTVYRRPSCLFVAQFIGFPPMNLLRDDNDDQRIFGLRAEHVSILSNKALPGSSMRVLSGKILLTEPLGNEVLATCLVGGQDIVTRLPASTTLRPGQDIRVGLDMSEAVWFDSESGQALEETAVLI